MTNQAFGRGTAAPGARATQPAIRSGTLSVVRVIARLNVGGPARHVVLLDRGLRARGHRTRLVFGSLDNGEASLEHLAVEERLPVVRIPDLGRRISPIGDARALLRLIAVLLRERPDVVHTHTAKAGTLGRLAALVFNATRSRRRRCLVVHTFHGHVLEGYFSSVMNRAVRLVERLLAKVTDRVVTISSRQRHDIADRFRIAPPSRTITIPLGLQLDDFLRIDSSSPDSRSALGIPAGAVVVGYVGRMVPIKALPILVGAFARASRERDDLWLIMVGDGPARREVEQLAAVLGIAGRVRFLGWMQDLPPLYATMDVCALSSLNEGTPVAIIEAMAAGRAVVAASVGGVADLIEHERTGLLVDPGDEKALAGALLKLAGDLDLRRRLGLAARDEVTARHGVDRLVGDVERMYFSALAARRGASEPRPAAHAHEGAPTRY